MGVQALFYSDRDGLEKAMEENRVYSTKAEADARDKLLELADEMRDFLVRNCKGLDEDTADSVSMLIAENRDLMKKAMTKPSVLSEKNIEQTKAEDQAKPARKGRKKKVEPVKV
ncbi:YebG family protein [Marinobacter sp.]|uniref:YebG family protein n=1 Tax=Marinobacter sp. TaxID=50741 RepID=UPI003561888F